MNIFWLVLLVIIISLLLLLFSSIPLHIQFKGKLYINFLFKFLLIFTLALLIKVFFFEIYSIPSQSMLNTLKVGNKIIVNKLAYGPKTPSVLLNFFEKKRMPGYDKISLKDIIVLKSPEGIKVAKRCLGLPGDKVQLKNGLIFRNDSYLKENYIQLKYDVKLPIAKYQWFHKHVKKINGSSSFIENKNDSVSFHLFTSANNINELRKDSTLKIKLTDHPVNLLNWTSSDWGPIFIPKKGSRIKITPGNLEIYKNILNKYENIEVEKYNNQKIAFNEKLYSTLMVEFKNDYFLFLGDNRANSVDSRVWGLVPQINIIGKVSQIVDL